VRVVVTLLVLPLAVDAYAQRVTTVEELTLTQTLNQLIGPLGNRPVGEAVAGATVLEVGTTPMAMSSGNFQFRLDPATGLLARTATTFGPAFAERAMTSGEGQVTVGASLISSTYTRLSGFLIDNVQLGSTTSGSPTVAQTGTASLKLSSRTTVISSVVGVSENLDIAVGIPMVTIKLEGTSALTNGAGVVTRSAVTRGVFSGLGDVSASVKYRFVRFGTDLITDAGGLAVLVNLRLPTGDRANLRGLGVTRALGSFVASGGSGRLRPHVNAGFEFWSKGVHIPSNAATAENVVARHQIQYVAGAELEASPKVTLTVDFLGRHILGAGQVGFVNDTPTAATPGVSGFESAVALSEGIQKLMLVPGLKVNLKGKLLLSLHVLTTLKNNGLRANISPVAALDLTL
jgi:hypothetical protein